MSAAEMEEVPPWTAEAAFAEFQKCFVELDGFLASANEAETRLKVIDTILFDILNWQKRDVEVEKYCRAVGFADYVFSAATGILLVIEAKRKDETFSVPRDILKPAPVAFGLLEIESSNTGKALTQAVGYAATLGSRYVAICNGSQWILALTYVHGQNLQERQVLVFDSLSSIRDNFRLFWDCFSSVGLQENRIHARLLESRKHPAPPKLASLIPGYPTRSTRNVHQNELSYILEHL